ncbi:MAG: diguanylate cyclase, partial [Planctomycetales bacterium]|nr:diguanylate cyclase [Planctomycetales bacterium]
DHFKKFNDTHGHQAGDEVLRSVGVTLKKVVKAGDIPCRYGGEEFAIVMPNTRVNDARVAAERVRKAIAEMEVQFEGKRLHVTASLGVAQIDAQRDAQQLIRRADDGVYVSKNAGRNQGHWHTGETCLPLDKDLEKAKPEPKPEGKAKPLVGSPAGSFGVRFRKLPDQRVLRDELNRRISESQRFGVPLSVVCMQVTDFDKLETAYGEAVGDLILDSVVAFTRGCLRDMDLLARLHRGMFAMLLPATECDDGLAVGRRIQSALTTAPLPIGGKELRLGVELGAAAVRSNDNAAAVLARARENCAAAAVEEAVPA